MQLGHSCKEKGHPIKMTITVKLGNCRDSQNAMLGPSHSVSWQLKKKGGGGISYLANKVIIGKIEMSHLLYVPNSMFNFWSKGRVHNLDHCFINLFPVPLWRQGLCNQPHLAVA